MLELDSAELTGSAARSARRPARLLEILQRLSRQRALKINSPPAMAISTPCLFS